ncbi:MAG TPA: DUF4446 family protein [Marmoricola sp.]|nr:DUF4446 family protein [Marmoricola sp.]
MAYLLGAVALIVASAALLVSLRSPRRTTPTPASVDDLPADTQALRQEVAILRQELTQSLRHLSVVRYDAFDDMGGELSWSLALVDDTGSGVVITAINGRQHGRTYTKSLQGWASTSQLSPEEHAALDALRA